MGIVLLAAVLFLAGLAGIAAFWAVLPRTPGTSPLAALLTFMWSCVYFASAILTWRRALLAAPAFLAATGLLMPLFWFVLPGAKGLVLALIAVACVVALLGYRYLGKAGQRPHSSDLC